MSLTRPEPSRPGSPIDAVAADAGLHLVADHLLDALVAGALEPSLVHVASADLGATDIGLLPLDGRHPTDLLVGFVAPAEWHALGIVTSGWAYPLGQRGSTQRTRTRVHLVTLVSRSGETAHRTQIEGDGEVAAALADEPRPAGEQVDLLRLALELPTDPPPCATDAYWTIEWLSALLALDEDDLRSWADVVDAHPAMQLLVPDDDLRHADFIEVAASFVRVCTWARLRRLAADGAFPVPELTPTEALWFDEGAFARFLLNRCPPLDMLRRQALDHLRGHLADRLLTTLGELGIPRRSWPDDADEHAA